MALGTKCITRVFKPRNIALLCTNMDRPTTTNINNVHNKIVVAGLNIRSYCLPPKELDARSKMGRDSANKTISFYFPLGTIEINVDRLVGVLLELVVAWRLNVTVT